MTPPKDEAPLWAYASSGPRRRLSYTLSPLIAVAYELFPKGMAGYRKLTPPATIFSGAKW